MILPGALGTQFHDRSVCKAWVLVLPEAMGLSGSKILQGFLEIPQNDISIEAFNLIEHG
jgi:hypothetical protein